MEDLILYKDEYLLKVKDHIDSWDYIQAKRLLIELLEEEPDNGHAHQLLGWIYASQLNQYDLAEAHFKLALKFDPEHASSYNDYIYLLKLTSRYDEVVAFAKKALLKDNVHADYILKNKAEAYEMLGEYNAAIDTFKEAIIASLDQSLITACENGLERIARKNKIIGESRHISNSILV